MRKIEDGSEKDPHPEEAALAAVSKDAGPPIQHPA